MCQNIVNKNAHNFLLFLRDPRQTAGMYLCVELSSPHQAMLSDL